MRIALPLAMLALLTPQAPATEPQTLVRVPARIRGFGQDGTRIAWLTGRDGRRCVRTLHVRSLLTKRSQTATEKGCVPNPEYLSGFALAGRAAAWDSFVAGGNLEFDAAIMSARVPERRAHRIASIHGTRGGRNPESYPTVAGAGSFLAFSTPTGVSRIVDGKARRLFAFSKPFDLAVGAGRVAVVRQEFRQGDGCGCVSSPDWRPDGKIGFLSSLSPPSEGNDVMLIDPSGAGLTRLTGDNLPRENLDWSQDGTRLTYDRYWETIAVAAADASAAHDVVSNGVDPSLSPDGSQIAFTRWVGEDPLIYVANADGSGERPLAPGWQPAWSPDGRRIAYLEDSVYLSVIDADGSGGPHRLGSLYGFGPAWSPDGTKLAYSRGYPEDGIWIASSDGTNERRLTTGPDYGPSWSPDGRTLVFASNRNDVVVGDDRDAVELYLVGADGSHLRPLTFSEPARWLTRGQARSAAGRLLASFEVDGRTVGVALAGKAVVVMTADENGHGRATVFDAATGRRLRDAAVPGNLLVLGGANGRWVVFRSDYRRVRALDLRTMKTRTLLMTPVTPVGLSVSGRRVAWAENAANGKSARIRALTLPR